LSKLPVDISEKNIALFFLFFYYVCFQTQTHSDFLFCLQRFFCQQIFWEFEQMVKLRLKDLEDAWVTALPELREYFALNDSGDQGNSVSIGRF